MTTSSAKKPWKAADRVAFIGAILGTVLGAISLTTQFVMHRDEVNHWQKIEANRRRDAIILQKEPVYREIAGLVQAIHDLEYPQKAGSAPVSKFATDYGLFMLFSSAEVSNKIDHFFWQGVGKDKLGQTNAPLWRKNQQVFGDELVAAMNKELSATNQ